MRRLRAWYSVMVWVWRDPANRGERLRRVLSTLAFQARGRFLGHPSIARFSQSCRVWAELDDLSSRRAVYSRLPDFAEMQLWRRTLRPGDWFVDVGANVGLYTLLAAEAGARVIAVEPDPRAVQQLTRNLQLNEFDADVHEAALADATGVMPLVGSDGNRQALLVGSDRPGDGDPRRMVHVTTLDRIIGERRVAGVKIDVEGAERLVLEGAAEGLKAQRIKLLQLEWNARSESTLGESREPVATILRQNGYELCRPDERGQLAVTEDLRYGADVFARPKNDASSDRW
jgi:FkbM family methyltransferase